MSRPSPLLVLLLVAVLGRPAVAQGTPDREAVRLAVLDYVEGFYEGDTTRLVRSVWPQVRKYGYWRARPDTAYAGEAMPFAEFLTYAAAVRAGRSRTPAGAPKEIAIYDVQDQTASAKLTAWWGTDYLLLAKERGRWMIIAVLWQSPPPKP
jgi:Putative lumazine-binding